MSELINTQSRNAIRWHLLATVSALSLAVTLSANAAEAERPTVWIELGGQLERITGLEDPFLPPFTMQSSLSPDPYSPISPTEAQKPSIYSYGIEGTLSFRPHRSDWTFTAAIRYSRSNNDKHVHQQFVASEVFKNQFNIPVLGEYTTSTEPVFADFKVKNNESHAILDFQAGHDFGIGSFISNVGFGVRAVDFVSGSHIGMAARPHVEFIHSIIKFGNPANPRYRDGFKDLITDYAATAVNSWSFKGLGPSVSWSGNVPVIGNEDGAITLDWGVNAAVLFGRQKANGSHQTSAITRAAGRVASAIQLYDNPARPHDRSRSVVVPNVGFLAGFSFRYPNAKVSFGYRADMFFGAMDVGIDQRDVKDRTFHGPFATLAIGL